MLAFPCMITHFAKEAGMKIPDLSEGKDEFDGKEYPHFQVFCNVQLCRPMDMGGGEPDHNAKVIMEFSEEEIKEVTLENLLLKGLRWQS